MKKIIALILCGAMLFSMASVSISAAYQEHIAVSGTTQTVDGVSYTIVRTEADLTSALTSGKKIMLANDIALTSATPITIKAGTLLDGNGYTVTYSGALTSSLFVLGGGGSETVIRNTQFGSSLVPMTTSGNIGLFAESTGNSGTQIRAIWQNNTFYINNSGAVSGSGAVGGLLATTTMIHKFSGCTVNATVNATGVPLVGAWIGSASGDLYFEDCTVTGSVTGSYGVGGFVGQNTSGRFYFQNCVNHAKIKSVEYCGGFSGNAGTGVSQLYFLNCINYGAVTASGSGYNGIAGGIIGRLSNTITYDRANHGFYGCYNYGAIQSENVAGGIVGRHHDYDSSAAQYLYFDGCFNGAQIRGANYAGGIIGVASPLLTETIIKNCANIGRISTSNGRTGNFAGLLSGAKVIDCYAAGFITANAANNRGVIAGLISGTYTVSTGPDAGKVMTILAPTVTNTRFLSNITTSSLYQGATKVSDEDFADFVSDMENEFDMSFIAVNSAQSTVGGYVTIAEPQIRGVQQSVAPAAGTTDLRFAAIINTLDAYKSIGFRTILHTNGQSIRIDRTTSTVYTALNATAVNGTVSEITAKSLSGQYLTAVTFTNIPTSGDVSLEITPYAIGTNGEEYLGKTRVIVVSKGAPKTETMLLNGVSLEKFAIVYPSGSPNNEQLLAERLAAKIGTLLGHTVSCYSDSTAEKDNEILIGKTNRHTPTVTGRWIYRTNEVGTSVVLTATGTTALSEVVEYFLNTLIDKRAEGSCSWNVEDSISVPIDEQVSIMAYNTGATDNSNLKKAEWKQIVDVLPDIFTMQEPWAGFLDDFLNDYAVKPTSKFSASWLDDDVMRTDVNNKAFTGSGYYGVYWGLPRWVPKDANTEGKASYSVILYAKDRFTPDLTRSGTFWLSNTPNTSGSTYPGSDFARCATYLTLTDKNTGETYTVVNVHLDFVEEVQIAQVSILLNELKSRVGTNIPIIITGDMNSNPNTAPMNVYFDNGWSAAENIADVSFHNNSTIDWILVNNTSWITAQRYEYLTERSFYSNIWASTTQWTKPSDHPAVYAELTVDTGKTRPGGNTEAPPVGSHDYGAWMPDPDTTNSHYRECECGNREVGMCSWEWTRTITQATHLAAGQDVYTCSECGRTETRATPKIETHSFSNWKPITTASEGHYRNCECGEHEEEACDWVLVRTWEAATMFEEGLATYTCSVCQRTEDRAIPKLPLIEVEDPNTGSDAPVIGTDPSTNMGDLELIG